jgi:type 1 fimbria pilin
MKLASKMFALTALAVACSAASAQQSAPLTVTGNITPPSCTASMSNDGAFKYADIDATTLNDGSTTVLPNSPFATFNISCLGAAQVSWAITDNRAGTSYLTSDTGYFGLGTDTDGHKIVVYGDHEG